MLAELFHLLATPAPLRLRRLGYVRASVNLWSRSRRCRRAWAPHLEAARAAVLEAAARLERRRTVVVLGSGLLDDVPLGELAGAFDRVRLVDVVHPWPARLRAARRRNVSLVTADVGGAAALALGEAPDLAPPLDELCGADDVDLVVSANLLSQLPARPLRRARARRMAGVDELGARIVRAHLDGLARLRARVCLVTDVEQIDEDASGREIERLDLLHGVPLPEPDRSWDWELAPPGEIGRDRRLVHRVAAYLDWGEAAVGSGRR